MNTDKASVILPWVSVLLRDATGKALRLSVPCCATWQNGKRQAPRTATVSIDRAGDTLSLSCVTSANGDSAEPELCKAFQSGNVCYHCLAAAMATAGEQGGALTFYTSRPDDSRIGAGRLLVVKAGRWSGFAVYLPRTGARPARTEARPAAERQAPPVVKPYPVTLR